MSSLPSHAGRCPVCECSIAFRADAPNLRDRLRCLECPNGRDSVPRERALALALKQRRPDWRKLAIHESSPINRGVSRMLSEECANYTATHYYPDKPFGEIVGRFRNENLEAQTFPDAAFDVVVSLDVFEHLFRPDEAMREVYRTLKPGGVQICTFPIYGHRHEAAKARAVFDSGEIKHLAEAQYHGNPVSGDGALVTFDYGYEVHKLIAEWAPFDVTVSRFAHRSAGILGDFTEVIICEKPA